MILADSIGNTGFGTEDKSLEQLQAVVHRYCLSLTGSGWDAEDLAQDTWLKAAGTLKSFGHTNPEAFLLRIARNTWIDQTRRKAVLTRILRREQEKVILPDYGSVEIEAALQSLMKHLSPLQRTVFLLRDVLGFTCREAAERLETTEGAVKAALHRARQSLEAVKADLENDALPLPEEEGLRAFLRTFAAAYRMGDIAVLVELSQRGEVEPATVTGIIQTRLLRSSIQKVGTGSALQLAA
ncbi:MAG: DNA-directed polymerase subunit sigma [Paenibacillus sp.]|jgi:RNA polymerase sigma-70 factor (ECF subfamily)|nr:DNA-directed polymerase subunit sigma [Paenibacillus sp.]